MNRMLLGLLISLAAASVQGKDIVVLQLQSPAGTDFEVATPADQAALVSFDDGAANYALTPHSNDDGSVTVVIEQVPVHVANQWRRGEEYSRTDLIPLQMLRIASGDTGMMEGGFHVSTRLDDTGRLQAEVERSSAEILDRAAAEGVPVTVVGNASFGNAAACPEQSSVTEGAGLVEKALSPDQTKGTCCVSCGNVGACARCVTMHCGTCCYEP